VEKVCRSAIAIMFIIFNGLYWTILFRNGREQWDTGTFTFRDTVV